MRAGHPRSEENRERSRRREVFCNSLADCYNFECRKSRRVTVAGDSSSGRTTDSGSVSRGSNPLSPARKQPPQGDSRDFSDVARSSSGRGHHPLKVETRVRVPYALPSHLSLHSFAGHAFQIRASREVALPLRLSGGHASANARCALFKGQGNQEKGCSRQSHHRSGRQVVVE